MLIKLTPLILEGVYSDFCHNDNLTPDNFGGIK